jgi:predicted nucleic acid-binding protein
LAANLRKYQQFQQENWRRYRLVTSSRARAVSDARDFQSLLELTVRPLQLGRQDVADEYELLLSYFPNLDLEPVSKEVLLGAAALRARHRLLTPDSILLATGIRSGATAAITNDDGWKAAQGLGIEIILLSQLVS